MYEIFENDENILAVAQNGDDKIIFVTCEPSALLGDGEVEAVPTFDPNTVVVAISKNFVPSDQPIDVSPGRTLDIILAKGTMLAEEIFAARS
jgi:hypothetical protein